MTNKKLSAIELLEAANADSFIYEQFEIPAGNEKLDAILHAPDMFELQREQKKAYALAYAKLKSEGFGDIACNEEAWQETLKNITDKDALERAKENKPLNLADQLANEQAVTDCILGLMPKLLKDIKGNLLFPDNDSQKRFRNLLTRNLPLFQLISNKYVKAMNSMIGIGERIKNSTSETNSENGD